MGRLLQLRAVTDEERQAVARLAQARTAQARGVERAQVVAAALDGEPVEDSAVRLHRCEERGVAGWDEHGRSGRP